MNRENSKGKEWSETGATSIAERVATWVGSVPSLVGHTIFFLGMFLLPIFGFDFGKILLVLTTLVSLEAIYLAIFIQMSVNRESIRIRDIREDVEEIGEDVEEIQKDVEEIGEDVEEITEDMEEEDEEDETERRRMDRKLARIETAIRALAEDIETFRNPKK